MWTLYNFRDKKIVRVTDMEGFVYGFDDPLSLDLPRRLSYPDGASLALIGTHTATYADTDENGHINNTVYADILSGFVPEVASKTARIVSFYINYANECPIGDELRIYRTGEEGEWYFRTQKSDAKTNVEVKILTE